MATELCEHGGTKRGCLICELQAENARLREELKDATADRPTMKLLTTVMGERDAASAEVESLRAGVKVAVDILKLIEDGGCLGNCTKPIKDENCQCARTLATQALSFLDG